MQASEEMSWSIQSANDDDPLMQKDSSKSQVDTDASTASESLKDDGHDVEELMNLEKVKNAKPHDYKSWSFGKLKEFQKPEDTPENKAAAVTLQRLLRGWWQRSHFKLVLYKYRLENDEKITKDKVKRIQKDLQKDAREEVEKEFSQKVARRKLQEETLVSEGKELTVYLRNENKKLREKNAKIVESSRSVKDQNKRLEASNKKTETNMKFLEKQAKQIQDTHDSLSQAVPKYRESVGQLNDAVDEKWESGLAEHSMKTLYVKVLGDIVALLEERCSRQPELVELVVERVLKVKDNKTEMPAKVERFVLEDDVTLDGSPPLKLPIRKDAPQESTEDNKEESSDKPPKSPSKKEKQAKAKKSKESESDGSDSDTPSPTSPSTSSPKKGKVETPKTKPKGKQAKSKAAESSDKRTKSPATKPKPKAAAAAKPAKKAPPKKKGYFSDSDSDSDSD